jgi:hypothetical protein
MRYHLKEDGNPGVCTAEPGKCPKGDAIHGNSVQDVYSQLEKVMEKQLFDNPAPAFEEPAPRKSPREIGGAGMMMHYTDPEMIRDQLEAFDKLGIKGAAIPILEEHNPVIAKAWEIGNENVIDYENFYEKPVPYREFVQSHHRGGDNYVDEYYTGEEYTWVAKAHYELQTAALNHLLDTLETGELEGTDLAALETALGNAGGNENAFLAFNFNPHRQDYDIYNKVKNRLLAEGFDRKKLSQNKNEYRIPGFLWKGLDAEAKQRFATQLLYNDLGLKGNFRKGFVERALGRDFGEIMGATFGPAKGLRGRDAVAEGQNMTVGLDYEGGKLVGSYKFTDNGFEWTEHERKYQEPKAPSRW